MKLIDKDDLVAEIESNIKKLRANLKICKTENDSKTMNLYIGCYNSVISFIDTLEVKEVIAEQECTCNEALNRIIGGSWNLLCPVNKLGLKTGDKVKVIIKAQKRE